MTPTTCCATTTTWPRPAERRRYQDETAPTPVDSPLGLRAPPSIAASSWRAAHQAAEAVEPAQAQASATWSSALGAQARLLA